jgi:leucyl-tRNA synthetase
LHLLYSRFWQKVLFDLGHVSADEPYYRLFNQGYIQAYAFTDKRGQYVEAASVIERDGRWYLGDEEVQREYGKMGKSLRNSVTPDDLYDEYGADTLRLYEMSMGPLEVSRPWETRAVVGVYRFLQRVWRNLVDETTGASRVHDGPVPEDLRRLLHRTIDGVRVDMAGLRFNTAVSKLIELNNALTTEAGKANGGGGAPREVAEPLVLMLAPLAPHAAEELWHLMGHERSLAFEAFPVADPALLASETVEYPVQVNGKVRSRLVVPAEADAATIEAAALADERIQALLDGAAPRKVIVVPGRTVNLVV